MSVLRDLMIWLFSLALLSYVIIAVISIQREYVAMRQGGQVPKFQSKQLRGWSNIAQRNVSKYIRPNEDTFTLRPSSSHFTNCSLLIVIHSKLDAFEARLGVRQTWLSTGLQKVENVSYVFLVGNDNFHHNISLG